MHLSTRYIQSKYVIFLSFLLVAFLSAPLDAAAQTTTPTNIQVTGTYVQPTVTRLGINLGDDTLYDSGQMMKNLTFANPGFEPMKYRSILNCVTVTSNTCTDGNVFSNEANGFWTGGTYAVVSGTQLGVSGKIVSSVMVPSTHCNSTCGPQQITFDKNVNLTAGNYVVVTNSFAGSTQPDLNLTNPGDGQANWGQQVSGNGTITNETTDLSPETPGKQALRMTATGASDSASLNEEWDTLSGHSFITMNGNYAVTFRAKGTGGNNILTVQCWRFTDGWTYFLNKNVTLTSGWADYTVNFTANENETAAGAIRLQFSVGQSAALLDDVSITQTNGDPTNTTAFRDDVVNTLKTLNPGTLRMNTSAAIGADLYDQIATPFGRYREGVYTNENMMANIPYGITEFLQLCAAVGADPWLTIPTATTPQEITDFVDYLTGSGSTTYSAIRVAEGQVAPWTSVFNTIHIELGNETWNGGFQGDAMGTPQYPAWANQVFGAARKAPGFNPAKFDLVLSGVAVNPVYNQAVMQSSTQHDSVSIAPYLAYTMNDGTTASLFQGLFAEPEWLDSPGGSVFQNAVYANQNATSASGTSRPTKISVYETNVSTYSGTITQTEANQFVPSVGAGIALTNHLLQMMRLGVNVQNVYELSGFQSTGSNGNTVQLWGTVVDMGTHNLRRPSFLAEVLANTAIQGSMLATVQTGANPTWSQFLTDENLTMAAAHQIQSFAFLNGTLHSLVLFNLNVANSLPVTFSGPNAPTGTVQVSQLTSANITDTNETSKTVQVASTTASISSTTPYVLPPYSMTVLNWNGPGTLTGPAQTTAPVFSLPSGIFSSPQTVTISDTTPGATIYYTTNGTAPTASSTQYTGPITVGLSQTLQAIAITPLYLNSPVVSANYTIQVQSIPYPSGFATSQAQMVLNGTAQFTGSNLQLTSASTTSAAGTAWYYLPVNVQSFTNDFTFQITSPNANGFTFALQNQGTSAKGMWGSGLGYQNITPSVAIKFDLFSTPGNGSIGIFTNGAIPTTPLIDLSSTGINLHSGDTMAVHMVYDGTNLTMTITDTVTNAAYSTVFPINIPAIVAGNSALAGFTGATGGQTATQQILTWNFTATSGQSVAAPTFSIPSGTYTVAQTVTILDATSGASIYYTTNGTIPTTSSTKYTGPITVSSTETVEAIAVGSSGTSSSAATSSTSAVATATYTISPVLPTPTFSVAAGNYTTSQTVSITDATAGATIYYTTNGTPPTTSSTKYTGASTVSSTETIEALAVATGYTNSAIATAAYTISSVLPTPTFSVAAGTYAAVQTVTIADATAGATIYYTTNGTTPTTSSTKYTGPITVSSTETIKAIAVATGYTNSAVATAAYTINLILPTPTFGVAAGTYTTVQTVTIADATAAATIYYTTNGTTPTTSSTKYAGAITVSSTETIEAIAVATGYTNSAVAAATYTISKSAVAAPTFSLPGGAYGPPQSVKLADATAGAAIYFTTDGTTPTASSANYWEPIYVGHSQTIKAIAIVGASSSAVVTATYTIGASPAAVPIFSPA